MIMVLVSNRGYKHAAFKHDELKINVSICGKIVDIIYMDFIHYVKKNCPMG